MELVTEIGRRIAEVSHDSRSTSFLRQRISVAIQRGNAACVNGTLQANKLQPIAERTPLRQPFQWLIGSDLLTLVDMMYITVMEGIYIYYDHHMNINIDRYGTAHINAARSVLRKRQQAVVQRVSCLKHRNCAKVEESTTFSGYTHKSMLNRFRYGAKLSSNSETLNSR